MHASREISSSASDGDASNDDARPIVIDRGRVTTVTLNRPTKRNAITGAMWRQLAEIFDEIGSDNAIRVVVLTGRGCFSAGADISEFASERANPAAVADYEHDVSLALRRLKTIPKATVAAIQGYCFGGGLALAQACDFRLGDSTCAFSVPAAKLGIVYSIEECRALADIVGHARAKQILLSAATFNGVHASRIGLIDLIQDGEALNAAQALARTIGENSPVAISGMKFILNCLGEGTERERRDDIDALIGRAAESREYRDAVAGFRSKRKAKSDTR